jgi:hypothetical protein
MFARIALRAARMALVRSPFARPTCALDLSLPAFQVRHGRRWAAIPARRHARRAEVAPALIETAFAVRRIVSESALALARRRSHLVTADSTVIA